MKYPKSMIPIISVTAMILTAVASVGAGNKTAKDTTETTTGPSRIEWVAYDVGLELAEQQNKHLFVDFTTSWCGWCKKMERDTFSKPDVIKMVSDNFIAVRVDGDSPKELDIDGYKITEKNLTKHEFGVRGYPTFFFLKPDGKALSRISGYRDSKYMMQAFEYVKDYKYDTTGSSSTQKSGD
ncbi:MAG: thioredoxin family protein [Candidatus Zixiibacteriota bacterium]